MSEDIVINGATLTEEDLADLRDGHTINAMRPDGSEIIVTPGDLENGV